MQLFAFLRSAITLLVLCAIIIKRDVEAAAVGQDQGQALTSGQGLYNASDNVVILNANNFESSIYGDTKGWLVEFYNSWCGFCFRFAPIWKALASDVYSWRDIVVVAGIDCADDENNPICREHEIMRYPTIKYFSVNARPSSLGIQMEKADNVDTIRHNLIDILETEQREGRGQSWPNITPYRNVETKEIWKAVSEVVKYIFLIFEASDSHLGSEVILDMHNATNLKIRRVTSENELLCMMHKVTKFPSLVALNRNDSQKLSIRIPTREGIQTTIREFMESKGMVIDGYSVAIKNPTNEDQTGNLLHSTEGPNEQRTHTEIENDYLYQLDLENTLRYSITHEIPLSRHIEGQKLDALKAYFNILSSYFPLRYGNVFLDVTRQIIEKKYSLTGEEFSRIVQSTEEEMAPVYSGSAKWIGCKGSSETYRGYPCGLWTMFHMLTVNFAARNANSTQYDPTLVLKAMHGYIKNFFGCADCSNHFVEMAERRKIFDINSGDESILWLWRAHNEVNNRLAGDPTEDPEHKKVQYPTEEHCPTCRHNNGTWDELQVLHYLKNKYSYSAINYTDSSERRTDDSTRRKIRQERLASNKYISLRKLGWDFTIFDISICVLLYVTSALILILVCIKFAVKRTYRKKTYVSLLGKV